MEPQFERMNSINRPSLRSLKVPVVWNEDVYALGRDSNDDGKLFKYSVVNNDWSDFSVPSSVYASNSVLTTYHSELLLISGKDMIIWELSINDFSFKQSNIKPVPSTLCRDDYDDFIAISKDECLIVCMQRRTYYPGFVQMIYNGRNWKFSKYEPIERFRFHSAYRYKVLIDSRDIIIIASSDWGNEVRVLKAPIWGSFGEVDGKSISPINWEELAVTSFAEFNTLICRGSYSTILHNQQVYFVDPRGVIITSFIQPPILPVVWGNSGVNFQHAPHLVGLPNGNMLMIGMIGHGHQHGSQLDVINICQKGNQAMCDHNYYISISAWPILG